MLLLLAPLVHAEPAVHIAGERLPDPHRWLEDIDAPDVVAWWTARDAAARAWIGDEATQAAITTWLEDWNDTPPPALLDVAGGVRLTRTSIRVPHAEEAVPAPTQSTRPSGSKHARIEAATKARIAELNARWRTRLVATVGGVDHALVTPELDEARPVCAWALDPGGRFVAWGRTVDAEEQPCRVHVTDLADGTTRPVFEGQAVSVAFSPDAERLLVSHVAKDRGHLLEITRAGEVVAERLHSDRALAASWLPDGNVIAMTTYEARENGSRYVTANRVAWGPPEHLDWLGTDLFWPPWGTYSFVGRDGDALLLRTNVDAPAFRVVRVDPARPWKRLWEEVEPERKDAPLVQARRLGDQLLLVHERDGVSTLEVRPLGAAAAAPEVPAAPTPLGVVATSGMSVSARAADAFVSTWSVDGNRRLRVTTDGTVTALDDGPRPDVRFSTELATSADGTTVPMSVVRPAVVAPDAPVWLHVYGGFGIGSHAWWSARTAAWLALGGIEVVVHARGGDERGEAWHEAAILADKHRTIEDVVAAAEWFTAHGTPADRIVLSGRSNGGMVVAATVAKRPDLFGAVVAEVGVHDLVRGPVFGRWWPREFGRPGGKPAVQRALRDLSPLHATPPGPLPPILLATGRDDRIVTPAHSFKLAAAWGELPGGPVLLRVDPWISHGGRGDNLDLPPEASSRAFASDLAFVLRALGMEWDPQGS